MTYEPLLRAVLKRRAEAQARFQEWAVRQHAIARRICPACLGDLEGRPLMWGLFRSGRRLQCTGCGEHWVNEFDSGRYLLPLPPLPSLPEGDDKRPGESERGVKR